MICGAAEIRNDIRCFGSSFCSLAGVLLALALFSNNGAAQDFDSAFEPVLTASRISEVAISPDGRHVVWVESKVKNDTEYAHTVFLTTLIPESQPNQSQANRSQAKTIGLGDPRAQLGTSSITWSPDSKQFAYVEKSNASEQSELRIASADGEQSRTLATWKGAVNTPRWSPDGRSIAVLYSDEDETPAEHVRVVIVGKAYEHQRLALVDAASGKVRVLSAADLFVYEYDWSPDSHQIAITAAPCCSKGKGTGEDNWWTAELYRLDLDGRATSIWKPQLQIASPRWSPDGKRVAFIGGLMSDFIAPGGDLFVIAAAGGQPRNVTPELKASITWLAWTGSEQILTTEIVDGGAAIVLVHTDNANSETLWQAAEGPYNGGLMFAMSIARDGTSAIVRESFNQAPEVWAGPVGRWRQISSLNPDVKSNIGKAESVHWTSDGMQVQGWLLYPRDFMPGRKYPMVVSVHGGPAAAALLHWPAAFDNIGLLSAFGYFVLYPNPRGSFGQGEAFTQGNVKNLGYGDLRDIEAGVKYATQNLPVDPHRVGITGWSYGGYMAMWAITQTDMFRASVAGPGVSDWESYYGQTEIEKWLTPYFGVSAYADPALYAKSSPIRFVKQARAPTLFYVGKEDPICPAPQTFQLWHALKHFGVETELLLYANEGHGVSLPVNQEDVTKRTLLWFDEHMK